LALDLSDKITIHPFELPGDNREFIGVSKKSALYKNKHIMAEFKQAQQDYMRLRRAYYETK